MAAEIRRQAERDAASLRRDAAEWASSIRREAEARAARTPPVRVDTAGGVVVPGPEPEVVHDPEPDALVDLTQPDQVVDLSVLPSPVAPPAPAPPSPSPTPASPTAMPSEPADTGAALEAALRSVLPAPIPVSPPVAEPPAASLEPEEPAEAVTGPEPTVDPAGVAAAELPDDPYEVGRLVALGSWMDAADFAGPTRPTGIAADRLERGSGDVIDLGRVVESRRLAELRRAEAAEQAERRARAGFRPVETSIETRVHDIVRQAVRRTFSRRSS